MALEKLPSIADLGYTNCGSMPTSIGLQSHLLPIIVLTALSFPEYMQAAVYAHSMPRYILV